MSEQELDRPTDELQEGPSDEFEEVRSKIEEFLNDDRVKIATVVFSMGDNESPHVLRKGHFYDNAALLNTTLDAYRAKAAVELGIN